jgi:capsular polysaccharide transport system permease protein
LSGVVFPNAGLPKAKRPSSFASHIADIIRRNRFFFGIVLLPTILAGLYYGLVAADQYESSAEFVVRRAESPAASVGIGQVLGFSVGTSASASEAYVVQTYLLSHDAVRGCVPRMTLLVFLGGQKLIG